MELSPTWQHDEDVAPCAMHMNVVQEVGSWPSLKVVCLDEGLQNSLLP